MKIERTKNAVRNIIYGSFLKIYQILVPFFMRTSMIYFLGMEYLGLDSLFISILQVLNLVELGVGSAMTFSMYKPVAEDDNKTICALMKLYKIYYRIIGSIILVIGLFITPFIPLLIKSDLPTGLNVYILYIMNLFATVFSYWLCAYKSCLLQAYQRNDIISKVTIGVYTIRYIFQFIVIIFLKDYYMYLLVTLITQLLLNLIISMVADKLYPQYKAIGNLDKTKIKEINQMVKDLFTAKIGTVVINSADTIVISAALGLTVLAVYQNYYYIITAVIGVVGVIFTSCTAGIGNSITVESKEKNYSDLKKFTYIISWISCFCGTCLLCLFQPFMRWWVGEQYLLSFMCVICFSVYYYIYEINVLLNTYKDAAGIWHKDRFRPLVTAVANLILNIILVNFIGIYGVILSTIITMLIIGMPWILKNLFSEIFKTGMKEYILKLLNYALSTILIASVTFFIVDLIEGYSIYKIIIKAIVCLIVSNFIWIILYKKSNEMNEVIKMMKRIIKK